MDAMNLVWNRRIWNLIPLLAVWIAHRISVWKRDEIPSGGCLTCKELDLNLGELFLNNTFFFFISKNNTYF
jgi:hypothetical protein